MSKKMESSPRAKAGTRSPGRSATKVTKEPAAGAKLLGILESQRQLGGRSYPPTLTRLVELCGDTPATVGKALALKDVKTRVLLSRTGAAAKGAPGATLVLFAEDAERIARDERLLSFQLELARTSQVRALDAAALCKGLARPLVAPFKAALARCLEEHRTPAGIGALPGKKPLFFLLGDAILPAPAPPGEKAPSASTDGQAEHFTARFDAAFTTLNRASGGHNFVTLHALREALPEVTRADFDAGLSALRRQRRYTLDPSDGRHQQMSEAERAAGVMEAGNLLVYVARRGDA